MPASESMSIGTTPDPRACRTARRCPALRFLVTASVTAFAGFATTESARGQDQAKPAFQYESGDIRVSVPTVNGASRG